MTVKKHNSLETINWKVYCQVCLVAVMVFLFIYFFCHVMPYHIIE